MGLLTKEVLVRCHSKTAYYYQDKGYLVPKKENGHFDFSQFFQVKVEDLTPGTHTKVEVECDECGKKNNIAYKDFLKQAHNNQYYCQPCSCKKLNSGENNCNYKAEKTEEERIQQRKYAEYKTFVRRVMKRDKYECYCCHKSISNKMVVHHLNSYDWFVEGRTDDTNAVTLCEDCHKLFHQKYGYGDNTKEQFEEWAGKTIKILEKGELIQPYQKVYCFETNQIYENVFIAEEQTKIKSVYIKRACNELQQTACNYHFCWYENYLIMTDEEKEKYKTKKGKQVCSKKVICLDTNEVFDSLKQAGQQYSSSPSAGSSIGQCCGGKRKTAYGKHWQFYEDYMKILNKEEDNFD